MAKLTLTLPLLLLFQLIFSFSTLAQNSESPRIQWLKYMDKVARPVLSNLANDQLKAQLPLEMPESADKETRSKVAHLEAVGRTLTGIAPWLNTEGGSEWEIELRNQYREWALQGIANAVDPAKDDYLLWEGYQPLVDAAFFAQALIRSPWLWNHLDDEVQNNVFAALKMSRPTIPWYSNWILFSSMVEAFFWKYDLDFDPVRIDYGIREFAEHWYVGDGMYSDGNEFAFNYYNSYVIQPFLMDILAIAVEKENGRLDWYAEDLAEINKRYAEIQERLINSDGTFPVTGRSIAYRSGAFHHLANMALYQKLPESLTPGQVRSGLTAVLQKTLDAPGTFNENGWLNIGLSGHQPDIAESYITTGSLYLCSAIFLPLGLPTDAPFWTDPDAPWTSKKVWEGENVSADHSLD